MDKKYENSQSVKIMQAAGFSDDYIMKAIASGDLKIEKAEPKSGDHESETKEEKDIDKLEKEAVKKEEKVKKDEKDTKEDKDAEGVEKSKDKKDKKDDEEVMKSIEASIMKSFENSLTPVLGCISKSLEAITTQLSTMGKETPAFRSAGLDNLGVIQKSVEIKKGDDSKYEINILSQRELASKLVSKAYDSMPADIQKSLEGDVLGFLTNAYADNMGEDLARYMYDKSGVKFVK